MKRIYLIGFITALATACVPEPDGPAPEDIFIKYYGEPGVNIAKDLIVTSTGEFVILGMRENGSGDSDFYLIKTDKAGNLLDSATFGYASGREDVPSKIKYVSDAEFLIVGTSSSANSSQLVYGSIDANLNVIDSLKAISLPDLEGNPLGLEGNDIIKVSDADEYILLGTAETTNAGTQMFVSRRGQANNRIWTEDKQLGFSNGLDDRALAIFEKKNGKLVVVGSTERNSGTFSGLNILVYVANELGTPDENTLVAGISGTDDSADDIPYDVLQKADNSYIIVGSTALDGVTTSFQLEVSGSATKLSEHVVQSFRGSSQIQANQAFSVTRTLTNEFIVVGKYQNFNFQESKSGEMMVIRTSQTGEHLTEADQYYGLVAGDDEANAVVTAPDGDVVVAATIDFGGGNGAKMIGLLKLNEFGELKD